MKAISLRPFPIFATNEMKMQQLDDEQTFQEMWEKGEICPCGYEWNDVGAKFGLCPNGCIKSEYF